MLITNIIGGLGNQMFQYAMGRALALKTQQPLKLDITGFETYPLRHYELNVFNIDIAIASREEISQLKQNQSKYQERFFHFDSEAINLKQNTYLQGYWQSEKYFIKYEDVMRKDFTLKKALSQKSSLLQEMILANTSVSLHIRRGDYVTNPTTNSFHGTCCLEYYKHAAALISKRIENPHFFIFSDDLKWAKENINFIEQITFVELDKNIPDHEEMHLMSQCKHNIIANSSFSWWGAWLNQNPDKIVIAPEQWFMDEAMDTKDLIPQSWLRLGCESSHTSELVSIIIPCYNQAQYLEEAVNSAIKQTYPNIEIIIVNDGSTDNTEKVALSLQKKYPETIRVITQVNKGLSEARNTGIRESLGEYILPLDSDDILAPRMIGQCMNKMIQNNADIVHGGLQCFGTRQDLWLSKPFSENNILYENLPHQSSLYRKDVWVKNKGYKQNMKEGYEDWEFWINAYKHNFTFHYLPEVLYYYRVKKISRDILAVKKDIYLKAVIMLNHPDLYTVNQVKESIKTLKETEDLADLYFYHDKNIPKDEEKWLTEISHHIKNNKLEEKQILEIFDKKVGLCNIDILDKHMSIQELYSEMDVSFVLFFSPIRYKVETLYTSEFAWDTNKGIVKAYGTFFPFVFKSERENTELQRIAHKRFMKYPKKLSSDQVNLYDKITVSVCVMSYNLEKYIAEALDSILMQKVNFRYNIVVGEDCSTDRTRKILQDYVEKYPNIFKVILHPNNIGMLANFAATLKECEGKYIALLDGDDYWTDPLKLQKQVDFLESNKEYSMVFHNIELHDETKNGVVVKPFNPEKNSREYTYDEIARVWSVGTCSVLCINNEQYRYIEKNLCFPVQDLPFYLCCASIGKPYYMAETMSVYRRLLSGSQNSEEFKSPQINLNFIEYFKTLYNDFNDILSKKTIDLQSAHNYFWAAHKSRKNGNEKNYLQYFVLAMAQDPEYVYEKEIEEKDKWIAKQKERIETRDKEIARQIERVETRDKEIARQIERVETRDKEIARQIERVETRDKELEAEKQKTRKIYKSKAFKILLKLYKFRDIILQRNKMI